MSWSGGSYTKGNAATGGWAGDASLGIGIEAGRHDTQDNDFATGINNCLAKDGQNAMTANINLGGYVPTNVGAGTAAAPAYCAGNDSNTGMFSPTADNIGFATNGSERVRIDNTGKVGIGTTSPSSVLDIRTNQVGISQNGPLIQMYSNDTIPPEVNFTKSRAATLNTNTIVQSGDFLGVVRFYGANGTNYTQGAAITGEVDGTPGASNDMPGRLCFYTTADGSGTATERMRITSNGNVAIGTSSPVSTNNLTVGDGTGTKNIVVNGGTSGTAGGAYVGVLLGGSSKALLGNYSGIIGGAYNSDPMLYFAGGTPRVVGIPAGVGDRFMKWNTADSQWTYDTSSARFKENIVDSQYGLQAVLALRSVEFDYKEPAGRHDVGFIAEEVLNVVPEVVGLDKEGLPEAVMYDRLTSVLCKAIQELNAKVEALEARVAVLEA